MITDEEEGDGGFSKSISVVESGKVAIIFEVVSKDDIGISSSSFDIAGIVLV